MYSSLFRASRGTEAASIQEKKEKVEEKIDVFIKIKKNKDNLCSSLFEIENFLCQVNKACRLGHLYKFLK